MKKVAILQSNYIPWKGYFDIINSVDLFIFHDDLQYTHGDWRNRNIIQTPNGLQWLSVPCGKSTSRLICDVELTDSKWQQKHWNKIEQSYQKAPYFNSYKEIFQEIYLNTDWKFLSEMNQHIIKKIASDILGISTVFADSREFHLQSKKETRVLELLQKVNADIYLSGPSAKDYLKEEHFTQNNMKLEWMNYDNYKEYNQLYPPFEHAVSILDLLFNEGSNAKNYMKSF